MCSGIGRASEVFRPQGRLGQGSIRVRGMQYLPRAPRWMPERSEYGKQDVRSVVTDGLSARRDRPALISPPQVDFG